jgi:hypothetical protein
MLKRDSELTACAGFVDPRSFVALWKHPGTNHPCVYLFGVDKGPQRRKIFERDKGRCQLETPACKGYQGWDRGQWHHIKGGRGNQHCDCLENALWSCGPCHRQKHVRPRFGEHK